MKDKITLITKILLDVMFFAGIAVTVSLPFSIKIYGRYNYYFGDNYYGLLAVFAVSGVLAVLILGELRRMLRTVVLNDCFVKANVRSLKRMGIYSFLIAAVTAFRLLIFVTPAVLILILTFVIAGFFSEVLAKVFDMAVNYKLENDMTI